MSALKFNNSSLMSLVKTPASGIWCKGVVRSISPDVSFVINSNLKSSTFALILSATNLAWIFAKVLFLEIIFIIFYITFKYIRSVIIKFISIN